MRECRRCEGEGVVPVKVFKAYTWLPKWGEGYWEETDETEPCPDCLGTGYTGFVAEEM